MFDQINKYKASFGRLFEAKTLKVMLEIALLTILLSFLGPIKNMIYTEVVNKLSLGITVKLGIIMFASYIVVQVIEECVSYFQIYLNTVLQLKLGQSVSHEINNKLAKVMAFLNDPKNSLTASGHTDPKPEAPEKEDTAHEEN